MKRWVPVIAGITLVVAIAMVIIARPTTSDIGRLQLWLRSFGPWAAVVSATLMIGQAVIAPLPANVITMTNGLVFGTFWGVVLSWSSSLAGASLCFFLARTFGKPLALRLAGGAISKAEKFFQKYGGRAVFLVRILPLVPFDAVSYAAGVVGVPFYKYLLATGVGTLPATILYSYIGSMATTAYWWVFLVAFSLALVFLLLTSKHLTKA